MFSASSKPTTKFAQPRLSRSKFRKSLVSFTYLPAILGPEMTAPILWAPGIFGVLSAGKPSMPITFLVLGAGVFWCSFGGGGSADFIFVGAGTFLRNDTEPTHPNKFVASCRSNSSHTGTNTPKFVPPLAVDDCRLSYSHRAVEIRVGLELAEFCGFNFRLLSLMRLSENRAEHGLHDHRSRSVCNTKNISGGYLFPRNYKICSKNPGYARFVEKEFLKIISETWKFA